MIDDDTNVGRPVMKRTCYGMDKDDPLFHWDNGKVNATKAWPEVLVEKDVSVMEVFTDLVNARSARARVSLLDKVHLARAFAGWEALTDSQVFVLFYLCLCPCGYQYLL